MRGQRIHRARIAHYETSKTPSVAQNLRHEPAIPGRWHAVQTHVGGHHVARSRLDCGMKWWQINVPQIAVRQVNFVNVAAAERRAVTGKMLRTGDHAARTPEIRSLKAAHLRRRHRRAEIRVFSRALHDPAPTRIARNVDHRRKGPVNAHSAGLARRHALGLLHNLRIP